MQGVVTVETGYMGGHVENPSYRLVCTGMAGHVEVVQLTFDPEVTSYREILEVFFAIHDPTSRDRQGNDSGPQYRSVIFYHDEKQHSEAKKLMDELNEQKIWPGPIVTELRPATKFFIAEDYHQEYFRNNPDQPYCSFVVSPKVAKFRQKFASKLRRGA
jgi:peptide-methionine (S)-S-oxide reductase